MRIDNNHSSYKYHSFFVARYQIHAGNQWFSGSALDLHPPGREIERRSIPRVHLTNSSSPSDDCLDPTFTNI